MAYIIIVALAVFSGFGLL